MKVAVLHILQFILVFQLEVSNVLSKPMGNKQVDNREYDEPFAIATAHCVRRDGKPTDLDIVVRFAHDRLHGGFVEIGLSQWRTGDAPDCRDDMIVKLRYVDDGLPVVPVQTVGIEVVLKCRIVSLAVAISAERSNGQQPGWS